MRSRLLAGAAAVVVAAAVAALFFSGAMAWLLYKYQGTVSVNVPLVPAEFGANEQWSSPPLSYWATFTPTPQDASDNTGGFQLTATLYNSTSTYKDIGTLTVHSDQLVVSVPEGGVSGSLFSSNVYTIDSVIINVTPSWTPSAGATAYGCAIEINQTGSGPVPYYVEYTYTATEVSGQYVWEVTSSTAPSQFSSQSPGCYLTGSSSGSTYGVTVTIVGSGYVEPGASSETVGSLTVNFVFNAAWSMTDSTPPSG